MNILFNPIAAAAAGDFVGEAVVGERALRHVARFEAHVGSELGGGLKEEFFFVVLGVEFHIISSCLAQYTDAPQTLRQHGTEQFRSFHIRLACEIQCLQSLL